MNQTPLVLLTEDQNPVKATEVAPGVPGTRKPKPVDWYRSPLEPKMMKLLHERSDWRGFLQTFSYLGILALNGTAAFYSAGHWPVAVTVLLVFLQGMAGSFMINGVHELGHGTVFKTKALNAFFDRVLSFLGFINFEMFESSHIRHHRYTLHPPDDLEVVLPTKVYIKNFLREGFVNYRNFYNTMRDTIRIARGKFKGEWELVLFPEGSEERRRPVNWARTLLVGHALILGVSIYFKLWLIPVLVTLAPFYGGWLFFLCNGTQHIGLQDNVSDFRLCCRTFTLNPLCGILYWHMNYHIEHHMYAAVPCYNLGRLHEVIKHDLPPCQRGIIAVWKEIAEIQRKQAIDPAYQYAPPLPGCPTS